MAFPATLEITGGRVPPVKSPGVSLVKGLGRGYAGTIGPDSAQAANDPTGRRGPRDVPGRVFITRPIPEPGPSLVAPAADEVVANPEDRPLSAEELRERVAGCDAVLCLLDRPDRRLGPGGGRGGCRVFANMAVGYNNIDVAAATRLGILVTNTPGVLTEATADLTWALILARRPAGGRGGPRDAGRAVPRLGAALHARRRRDRAGPSAWSGRAGSPRPSPSGPRVPDAAALPRAGARAPRSTPWGPGGSALDELLAESDFVSLHVPL